MSNGHWQDFQVQRENFNFKQNEWWYQECPVCDYPGLFLRIKKKMQTVKCSQCGNVVLTERHFDRYGYRILINKKLYTPEQIRGRK